MVQALFEVALVDDKTVTAVLSCVGAVKLGRLGTVVIGYRGGLVPSIVNSF